MRYEIIGIRSYSISDQLRLEKLKLGGGIGFPNHQIKRPFTLGEICLKLDAREEIRNDVANITM